MYQLIQDLLRRPIAFHRVFAAIMGCAAGGLFLSQLYYWSTDRKAHDPENFIYKTLEDWQSETHISRREWEKARARLKSLGLLEEQRRGLNPQLWYKLDIDLLYETIVRNSQNPHESGIATSDISQRKIEHHLTLDLTSPDVRSNVRSISTESTDQKLLSESTNTDPERAHENEKIEPEKISEPEQAKPLEPAPKIQPLVKNSTSGQGRSSAACYTTETTSATVTEYLAQTEKRYSPKISRQELAELTQSLVDTYNKVKPSCWGTCTQITVFLINQVSKLLDRYCENSELPIAIESLKNDVAAAHLSIKGDDFYDKPSFGIPSISFFLHPDRVEKLQERAQVWYDRPQQKKEQLARAMVREVVNGVPDHETGKILSEMILHTRRLRFKKLYDRDPNHPDLPDLEHLHRYYPEIFS